MRKLLIAFALFLCAVSQMRATVIVLPMDEKGQRNHLKAYGITYWILSQGVEAWWLLNYRGGSFAFVYTPAFEKECKTRDVSYEVIADGQFANLQNEILNPEVNQDVIKLEKAPKIAVYTPDKDEKGEAIQPWDDAVTLVLTYAEIPYDVVYDNEVMQGKLAGIRLAAPAPRRFYGDVREILRQQQRSTLVPAARAIDGILGSAKWV
jgi:hypothetical protein